jgi:hypothetical protein
MISLPLQAARSAERLRAAIFVFASTQAITTFWQAIIWSSIPRPSRSSIFKADCDDESHLRPCARARSVARAAGGRSTRILICRRIESVALQELTEFARRANINIENATGARWMN